MAPSYQCADCDKNVQSTNALICGSCSSRLHVKCASSKNPNLTGALVDLIKQSKGGVVFNCWTCLQKPKTSSDVTSDPPPTEISLRLMSLESSLKDLKIVSENIMSKLDKIQTEVLNCSAKTIETERFVKVKFQQLETDINSVRRQSNRSDVVISGLPSDMSSDAIYETVFKIGNVLDVEIQHNDLNICTYIRNKKAVLVKFNSTYKRDLLFKKYMIDKNLKLNQISDTNIASRIFINDNLTPLASKMSFMCRKLLKHNKIKKFNLINKNIPEVKIVSIDGTTQHLSYEKLLILLKEFSIE